MCGLTLWLVLQPIRTLLDDPPDAEQVTSPTLLVSGELTFAMLQLIVDVLAGCLPNSESVVIPGATHNFPTAKPDIYNKIVLEFFTAQAK